jgi:hypothetical protein
MWQIMWEFKYPGFYDMGKAAMVSMHNGAQTYCPCPSIMQEFFVSGSFGVLRARPVYWIQ